MSEFKSDKNPEVKETKNIDDFAIGDVVAFDMTIKHTVPLGFGGNEVSVVKALIEKYGEGPFVVRAAYPEFAELIAAGHGRQRLMLENQITGKKLSTSSSLFKKYSA